MFTFDVTHQTTENCDLVATMATQPNKFFKDSNCIQHTFILIMIKCNVKSTIGKSFKYLNIKHSGNIFMS